jgi:hypothetical protein
MPIAMWMEEAVRGAATTPGGEAILAPDFYDNFLTVEKANGDFQFRNGRKAQYSCDGAAITPAGTVVPAPSDSANIGVIERVNGRFQCRQKYFDIDFSEPLYLYGGAVTARTGEIILVPGAATHVGVVEPRVVPEESG